MTERGRQSPALYPTPRRVRLSRSLVPVLLGAVPSLADAAWEAVPEVNLGVTASDNVLRTPEGMQSGSRTVLDGRVALSYFDERANLFVLPRLTVDTYADSDQEALENEDVFLRAGGEYRWQTVTGGFRVDYADRSVL